MPIRRLPDFDYSREGAYFITIGTYRRRLLFSAEPIAAAVRSCWDAIPSHFAVELDVFVVMPNHVHGILFLRAGHARPLPVVVGSFKSAVTRSVNALRDRPAQLVWQRGYYDRIIRSEQELEALREYIAANPTTWNTDPENPLRTGATPSAPWLS